MKQMKKVLSLLLCFAMLCSMALSLAPQASADGSSEHWVAAWHGSVLNAKEVYGCAVSITAAAGRENTSFMPSCHIFVILSHSVPEIPLSA